MGPNKFYDIHFHAMDLSHANLTAFVDRYINNEDELRALLKKVLRPHEKFLLSLLMPVLGIVFPYKTIAHFICKALKNESKVRNLLSFMETSVLYDFLIVEYYLRNVPKNHRHIIDQYNNINVGLKSYNKMILCPLIMDFGYSHLNNENFFYNIPPQKPVIAQIKDLFEAIHTYYTKDLTINPRVKDYTKFEIKDTTMEKSEKFFEIYPFMGINTANYSLKRIEYMLEKYFSKFSKTDTRDKRYKMLNDAMGTFDGDLSNKAKCKNIFAGIKLYPPLGFHPWPQDKPNDKGESEQQKVEFLYQYCIDKNIPIICHCSTGGFVADKLHRAYTDPNAAWAKVLADPRFETLKINFAHLGSDDDKWTAKILELALNPKHRVYADFSSNADSLDYYQKLNTQLSACNNNAIYDKIIYGSDFMINLLKVNSLNEYMLYFIKTMAFYDSQKHQFANKNPEEFLFGK